MVFVPAVPFPAPPPPPGPAYTRYTPKLLVTQEAPPAPPEDVDQLELKVLLQYPGPPTQYLVVGAGAVGTRRVKGLLQAEAHVVVVSPMATAEIADCPGLIDATNEVLRGML